MRLQEMIEKLTEIRDEYGAGLDVRYYNEWQVRLINAVKVEELPDTTPYVELT